MKELQDRLAHKQMTLTLTEDAKKFIVESGFDPVYGARPLKRYIQKHVETMLARGIIAQEIVDFDTIEIDVQDGKLVIKS